MVADRPNILMVMADSLAPHFTGAHGDPCGATPNLDRLAREGVLFERAYCNSPMCTPSRSSMVAGRYVGDLGAFDNANEFSAEWPTMGHVLGSVGYETAIIGKMHFIGHDQHHGFDLRLAHAADYTSGYDPHHYWIAYDWDQPSGGNPAGPGWMGPSYVRSPQWDHYPHHFDRDEAIHSEALRYLDAKATQRRPFFACVSYHHPHNPFWIPAEDHARFADAPMPRPPALSDLQTCHGPMDRWINDFHYVPEIRDRLLAPENLRWLLSTFYGMIFDWDRRLGQLLDSLQRTGLAENTAVIVTSDHGDMVGWRGMIQKRSFYERSLRVPLLGFFPGRWRKGARLGTPVSLIDLLPTLADLGHAAAPEGLPGTSLRACLEMAAEPPTRTVFAEYHGEGVHAPCYAAIRRDAKYVLVHGHEERFYRPDQDPDELTNRIGDPTAREVASMRSELMRTFDPEATARAARASQRRRRFIHRAHIQREALTRAAVATS
jgi:choline-sulfatase